MRSPLKLVLPRGGSAFMITGGMVSLAPPLGVPRFAQDTTISTIKINPKKGVAFENQEVLCCCFTKAKKRTLWVKCSLDLIF